jgi:hypothetical protein
MMRERKGRRPRWRKKGDGEANGKRRNGDGRKTEGDYALLLYARRATFMCTGLDADEVGVTVLYSGVVVEVAADCDSHLDGRKAVRRQ